MWLHSYTAPVVVLLAVCAIGLGLVEFRYRTDPTAIDLPGQEATVEESAGKSADQGKANAQAIDSLQHRLTAELEQMQKRQDAERRQFEEVRRKLVTDVLTKEDALRRLEQRFASERDREVRMAAGLEDEQLNLEKSYRTLDPTGVLGKDHSEVRKLDTSLQQVRSQLAERAAQFNAREEKVSADLIEIRLDLETAKQKLKYEDDRWSRRAASLDVTVTQLRRSQEMMALRRELPDMERMLRIEADEARSSRIEEKLDQLSRELGELKQQLAKP